MLLNMLSTTEFLHQTTTISRVETIVHQLSTTEFLHQTTTRSTYAPSSSELSTTEFLHQTTTLFRNDIRALSLSTTEFLHQTTTIRNGGNCRHGCQRLNSYIKPQPVVGLRNKTPVVNDWIPTSNHNDNGRCTHFDLLSTTEFLHQTTTLHCLASETSKLSTTEFLHQTTTYLWIFRMAATLSTTEFLHQTTT